MKYLIAVVMLALTCNGAFAQPSPSGAITLVVPAAPGGPSDAMARVLADQLKGSLNQTVVVENRGGANGTIGVASVIRSSADGHTILFSVDGPLTTVPSLMPASPYDASSDLMPVAVVGDGGDVVLAVPASSPARDPKGLAELLRSNPGKANYVSSGAGFPSHIVGELYKRETQVFAQHIAMKGAGAAMTELLSGRYSFSFPPASLALPYAKAGKIRVLAVAGEKRNSLFPDVPTFAESGYPSVTVPGYWIGTYVPKATPGPIIEKLAVAIRSATHSENFSHLLESQGMVASDLTPEQILERVRRETTFWNNTIRQLNIKAE